MSTTSRTDPREAAQQEAVDAVVRALEFPARSLAPERGLRTQVVMATGSGKTRVAARSAEKLRAGRVLVLVPSLDLLTQTEAAWRVAGRRGPMVGVSSLRGEDVSFPNTTCPWRSWSTGCGPSTRSPCSPPRPPSGWARWSARTRPAFPAGTWSWSTRRTGRRGGSGSRGRSCTTTSGSPRCGAST
ncbi:DEAD/DEAH box helicase family protein [Streptomyces sp. NPDC002640]